MLFLYTEVMSDLLLSFIQ